LLNKVAWEVARGSVELSTPPTIGVGLIDDVDDVAGREHQITLILTTKGIESTHSCYVALIVALAFSIAFALGIAFAFGIAFALGVALAIAFGIAFALSVAFTLSVAFALSVAFTLGVALTLSVAFALSIALTLSVTLALSIAFALGVALIVAFTLGVAFVVAFVIGFCGGGLWWRNRFWSGSGGGNGLWSGSRGSGLWSGSGGSNGLWSRSRSGRLWSRSSSGSRSWSGSSRFGGRLGLPLNASAFGLRCRLCLFHCLLFETLTKAAGIGLDLNLALRLGSWLSSGLSVLLIPELPNARHSQIASMISTLLLCIERFDPKRITTIAAISLSLSLSLSLCVSASL
jgi:hypothetical protein